MRLDIMNLIMKEVLWKCNVPLPPSSDLQLCCPLLWGRAASPLSLPRCVTFLVGWCLASDGSHAPQVVVETDCVNTCKELTMRPSSP